MNSKFVLLAIKYENKKPVKFKLADITNLTRHKFGMIDKGQTAPTKWLNTVDIMQFIYAKDAEVLGIKSDNMFNLVGTNGALTRYADLTNYPEDAQVTDRQKMVIIERVSIAAKDGYVVMDVNGTTRMPSVESLVQYAEVVGIANGKLVKNSETGTKYIAAIKGEFPRVGAKALYETSKPEELEESEKIQKETEYADDDKIKLTHSMSKRDMRVDYESAKVIGPEGVSAMDKITLSVRAIKNWSLFIYNILSSLTITPVKAKYCTTIGVNQDLEMVYCPAFVLSIQQAELTGVLIHEAYHLLFAHPTRGRYLLAKMYNKYHRKFNAAALQKLHNVAADLYVNKTIAEQFNTSVKTLVAGPHKVVKEDPFVTNNELKEAKQEVLKNVKLPDGGCFDDNVDIKYDTVESLFAVLLEKKLQQQLEQMQQQMNSEDNDEDDDQNQSNAQGNDDDDQQDSQDSQDNSDSSGEQHGNESNGSSDSQGSEDTEQEDGEEQDSNNDSSEDEMGQSGDSMTQDGADQDNNKSKEKDSKGGQNSSADDSDDSDDSDTDGDESGSASNGLSSNQSKNQDGGEGEQDNTDSEGSGQGSASKDQQGNSNSKEQQKQSSQGGKGRGSGAGGAGGGSNEAGSNEDGFDEDGSDEDDSDNNGSNQGDNVLNGKLNSKKNRQKEKEDIEDMLKDKSYDERIKDIMDRIDDFEDSMDDFGDVSLDDIDDDDLLDKILNGDPDTADTREAAEKLERVNDQFNKKLKDLVLSARNSCKQQGEGNESPLMRKLIDMLLSAAKVNWRRLLGNLFRTLKTKEKSTYLRESRRVRYDDGMIAAGKTKVEDGLTDVIFAIDVSGSVGDKELSLVCSTIYKLVKETKVKVDIIWWSYSTAILETGIKDLRTLSRAYEHMQSDGGTNVDAVFKCIKDNYKKPPKGLIIYTDGYFSMPSPNYKHYAKTTIWLIWSGVEIKPPFGVVAQVSLDNK